MRYLVLLLLLACKPDHTEALRIYRVNCVACHGVEGRGDGPAGIAFNPPPRNFHLPSTAWVNGKTREGIIKTLTHGVQPNMWPYSGPAEDIPKLADYILYLGKDE